MKARCIPLMLALASAVAAAGCTLVRTRNITGGAADSSTPSNAPATVDQPTIPADAFAQLKDVAEAHAELCAPDDQHPKFPDDADLVTKQFCQDLVPGGVIPTPHGLSDLLRLLALDFKDPAGANGAGGNPAFAVLGHSSALTARKISSIAPTAFIFTPPPADGSPPAGAYSLLAFDPGEQFVEVAVNDPTVNKINFYIIMFEKACNGTPAGCTPNDLLTPNLVVGWSNVRVYEMSTTLGNTIFDCHVCHQPNNAQDRILRMQEIEPPFTHWLSAQTVGGGALLADFHAAHGRDEDYGGIPAPLIDKSDPGKLAAFLRQAGFGDQPNGFRSAEIESEVAASAPQQPAMNTPPGQSPTWQALYENAVAGRFIATPYHDVKVSDPNKLAHMTSAYLQWKGGAPLVLPDIRDVFLDEGLRDMGFAPQDGLDGRGLLVQMCQQCHNANLDMTITRERFLVDRLDAMSRQEKDLAITRLGLPETDHLRMPPLLFRTITAAERGAMIDELQK
jgi:hypothetical protein